MLEEDYSTPVEGVKLESKYPGLQVDTKSVAQSKIASKVNQKRIFPFAY